eukprot:gb/GECH01010726.1/.p1 GENE.gb/GECH01010726.1/~~gb/GECH01010726.1/.p1  ORF type:complete len:160 (+),score=18.22 gb/GECH01010726.1/:1-480(+)
MNEDCDTPASEHPTTILGDAAQEGDILQVKQLIRRGHDVNGCTLWKWTPLHAACRNGQLNVVQVLLRNSNIRINSRDESGYTPLHAACEGNHVNVVQKLLSVPEIDLNAQTQWGYTPLHCACFNKNVPVIRQLLQQKHININLTDKDNCRHDQQQGPCG